MSANEPGASTPMVRATNLGFPRIGARRELKRATEAYWAGRLSQDELQAAAREIRLKNWKLQEAAGLEHIPSNDFSLYDHVLDMSAVVGAVPARYGSSREKVDLDTYFAMARGSAAAPAMEMTKWFDTNYHYLVPEFAADQEFSLASTAPVDAFIEAREQGIHTRPVLLGPVSYLLLGKGDGIDLLNLLGRLLPVYEEILRNLEAAGADWVQIDEPLAVLDQPQAVHDSLTRTYRQLSAASGLRILVATYFGGLRESLAAVLTLPVAAVHLDLVRAPGQLGEALDTAPEGLVLSLGVIDGRNVWRADLRRAFAIVERAVERLGEDRVLVAPSCSLLHVPVTLKGESGLDAELEGWMAFAEEKLGEVHALARGASEGEEAIGRLLEESDRIAQARRTSPRSRNKTVRERVRDVSPEMLSRSSPYAKRAPRQREALDLPLFPTTTIGSFPQTPAIRKARASHRKGELDLAAYEDFLEREIADCVAFQREAGIDVLVHGEAERNDMVEYFGELLEGYAITSSGWVQSYGSRCVKPPIVFGDVARPKPMTVRWSKYAKSLTEKPMKGMLTGPVTMLQWAFVRDDQPRSETARQISLALRDEVVDLEAAGIQAIQIDEPAFREGLPLRKRDWGDYLNWAVDAFRLSSCGVRDETQIHTHMCYGGFNDIIDSIARLDADVISIETSRSRMELLGAFAQFRYPNEIGPGVYDIHSPRTPSTDEMEELLKRASAVLRPEQIWVNPDCGLKTRKWEEVREALANMVEAARRMRTAAASE